MPEIEYPTTGPISTRGRRAVNGDGLPWWIHDCGAIMSSTDRPGPHACRVCGNAPGPWRELYRVAPVPPRPASTSPEPQPQPVTVRFEPEFEAAILAAAHRLADEAGVPRTLLADETVPTSGDWIREYEGPAKKATQ